jgi:hypothetical protein
MLAGVDGFTFVILVFGVGLFTLFWMIGRYHPKSGADVLDWKPTRSYEDEISLELEDVDQMLEAQNERRRASGRPELTEHGLRAEVEEALQQQRADAERLRRERGEPDE